MIEGEGVLVNGKTDDLNETTGPDSLEGVSKSLGVTDYVRGSVEDEAVLLDESVELLRLAGVVGSDLQRNLDADDDGLYADDVFCDLDRIKTKTSR
jgi:hypothetical protein